MTPNFWWLFEVLGLRRPVLPPPSGPQAVDSLRAPGFPWDGPLRIDVSSATSSHCTKPLQVKQKIV